MDIATLKREYLAQRGIISKDEEIDVVGVDGSDGSFAMHRKKLSAFTIESILSGMADMKDDDSMSETNLNNSFDEDRNRDFQRSPSPATSTTSSPPTSPHMSAVMAHHIRQYQSTQANSSYFQPEESSLLGQVQVKQEPAEHHPYLGEEAARQEDGGSDEEGYSSLTKSHLPVQRPIPLFSSHHLPLYIREKLRAAASCAANSGSFSYPAIPHPALPLRPISPETLKKMTEEDGSKLESEPPLITIINNNNNVETQQH